jgi:hypothetical protein
MKPASLLRASTTLAVVLLAVLAAPSAGSAQIGHSLNLGFNGGTWSGEDYFEMNQGIGVDASFLFGVQDSYRVGPVVEYGNFAVGDTGYRIEELDIGVEGRFIDMSRRFSVDPYIALRAAYVSQSSSAEGNDASTGGFGGQASAGFFFPFGASDHAGDLAVGIRGVTLGDWENDGTTIEDSAGSSVYFFVRVGIAFQFGF